jgi:N-acetyl sugar amidotransferase
MKYCKNCILPDTRPEIIINKKGICSACERFGSQDINWKIRKLEFNKIVKHIKKLKLPYDCLIPVSGGKDSTWQVDYCLKKKLNPLTFTYRPILRTDIGRKNLDNLIKLGVDHIDFSINRKTEIQLLKKSFFQFGAVAIPMHMAMWSISFNLAEKFKIPYIFWGENSAVEYSGTKKNVKIKYLNEKWIKKFGINFGKQPKDWIDKNLTKQKMFPFLRKKTYKSKAIFLGDYLKWDPIKTYNYSKKLGFIKSNKGPLTGVYDFADIDDNLISIHHFLKLYKFGFTRSYDNLSIEIRNKRMTRQKALLLAKKDIKRVPHDDIRKFCKLIKIDKSKFFKVCEKFRNKKIWKKINNKWILVNPLN